MGEAPEGHTHIMLPLSALHLCFCHLPRQGSVLQGVRHVQRQVSTTYAACGILRFKPIQLTCAVNLNIDLDDAHWSIIAAKPSPAPAAHTVWHPLCRAPSRRSPHTRIHAHVQRNLLTRAHAHTHTHIRTHTPLSGPAARESCTAAWLPHRPRLAPLC